MLSRESGVSEPLQRTKCCSPAQACELITLLDEVTVAELLEYQTAQELATFIEKRAREQYRVVERTWSQRERITESEYLTTAAPITLSEMGDIAFRLLKYAHQMFDPIQTVLYGTIR